MALLEDLLAAPAPAEILRHVARATWAKAHDSAECPDKCIPDPEVLATWLPECPDAARDEAAALLAPLFEARPTAWQRVTFDGAPTLYAFIQVDEARPGMLAVPDGAGGYVPVIGAALDYVHEKWCAHPAPRPRHPLTPLVDAWQRRALPLQNATATATRNRTNMTRRVQVVSTVRRAPWTLDATVAGAVVDGEPMAAPLPDPTDLFPVRERRPRRRFKPREQRTLPLPGVPRLQPDLRLMALHNVSAAPESSPALPGDVLALLNFAHVADRPLILTEREGAALLVRHLDGDPRPVQLQHDVPRFWQAAAWLRSLLLHDPGGSGRWLDLATVEVPSIDPVDRVTIGAPPWARGEGIGKWTLTAEGSAAAAKRVAVGKQGLAGRVVTGLEYRLAAGYSGRPGTVAPDLRPANARRKAGAGAPVTVPWRDVLRLAGDWWDPTDPAKDDAARKRFDRAVATLERRGYFVGEDLRRAAPAGDSVEIVCRVRGSRNHPPGLTVRASARFVEAARLAQLPRGTGFERMLLTDYAGLGPLRIER